jgi:hypothetical protein
MTKINLNAPDLGKIRDMQDTLTNVKGMSESDTLVVEEIQEFLNSIAMKVIIAQIAEKDAQCS